MDTRTAKEQMHHHVTSSMSELITDEAMTKQNMCIQAKCISKTLWVYPSFFAFQVLIVSLYLGIVALHHPPGVGGCTRGRIVE